MTKLVKEDWERAHLLDMMYLKEMEFQEQEEHAQWKPPAKINFKLPKNEINRRRMKLNNLKNIDEL